MMRHRHDLPCEREIQLCDCVPRHDVENALTDAVFFMAGRISKMQPSSEQNPASAETRSLPVPANAATKPPDTHTQRTLHPPLHNGGDELYDCEGKFLLAYYHCPEGAPAPTIEELRRHPSFARHNPPLQCRESHQRDELVQTSAPYPSTWRQLLLRVFLCLTKGLLGIATKAHLALLARLPSRPSTISRGDRTSTCQNVRSSFSPNQ